MDSINSRQPEINEEHLFDEEAQSKIKELIEDAKNICFFCTQMQEGKPFSTRPMSVQEVDDDGDLWFLSANDSHKNHEIQNDSYVQLLFKGSGYSDFLSLYGRATVSSDRQKIEELWKPIMKTWFTEGKNDPRISVIRITPVDGYYWDTKHGTVVAFAKQLIGAAVGKTYDDSIEGTLKP